MSEIEFIDIFGDNLQDIMSEQGYTQSDLASSSGVSQSAISSYINKTKMISLKSLINICVVLNCEVTDLLPYGGLERIE